MSREIKFRMVYKTTGEIIGYTDAYRLLRYGDDVLPDYEKAILQGVSFEQYTGLKDKNGKEIYEGDIVALLFGYVPMKSVTTENIRIENAQKAVIHFDTTRAAFRYTIEQLTPKDCQFKAGTKTNMVVIGNIHENPELLGCEDND